MNTNRNICIFCENEFNGVKQRKYCNDRCKYKQEKLMQLERLKQGYVPRKEIKTLFDILPLVYEEPEFHTITVMSKFN